MSRGAPLLAVAASLLVASVGDGDVSPAARKAAATHRVAPDPAEERGVPLVELAAAELRNRTAASRIRGMLARRITISFRETPLDEALRHICSIDGPEQILFNASALAEEEIETTVPIMFEASDVTIAQALHRILEPHGLAWQARHEALRITTRVNVDEVMKARTYNVRWLADAIRAEQKASGLVNTPPSPNVSFITSDPAIGAVIDLISESTSGPWWDVQGDGGSISVAGNILAIRQTDPVHDEVAALLRCLEAFLDGRLHYGMAFAEDNEHYPAADDAVIRVALGRRMASIEFKETPLREAAAILADQARVRIVLDETALREDEIPVDAPITLRANALTLQSILSLALERVQHRPLQMPPRAPGRLAAVIDRGFLLLTTKERAGKLFRTAVYDVRDLAASLGDGPGPKLVRMVARGTGVSWQDIDGNGGTLTMPLSGVLVVRHTDAAHSQVALLLAELREAIGREPLEAGLKKQAGPTEEELAQVEVRLYQVRKETGSQTRDALVELVEPAGWNAHGGAGLISIVGEALAVKNTRRAHRSVRQFLDDLKEK